MALTRKIASGGTVANFSTYVGEKGHLFYNSDTGDLRISDGVTPGGNSLALTSTQIGDLSVNGASISTINANEDLNLVSNGTGNVNVFGNFNIHTDGIGSSLSFNAASNGLITINSPTVSTTQAALSVNGSSNTTNRPVTYRGTMLDLTGNDNQIASLIIDAFGTTVPAGGGTTSAFSRLIGRTGRGTLTAPATMQLNDEIFRITGSGYSGGSSLNGYPSTAHIRMLANENFNSTSSGSRMEFYVTANGNTITSGFGTLALTLDGVNLTTANKIVNTNTTNSTSTTTGAITTAGGLGVAQDFYIGGSIWANSEIYTSYVGSLSNGSTLTLQGGADAQGAVAVKSNSFSVTTTTLTSPALQINALGHTTFTDLDPGSIAPTVVITGNTDSSTQAPNTGGVQLHVTGDVGTPGRIYNDGQADYAVLVNRRYNGTSTSPTAVLNTQIIGRIGATPYTSAGWPTISTARIDFIATEDQTGTNQGNAIDFYTIPNGSTTPQLSLQVANTGVISLANFLPYTDNTYNLGSSTQRWKNVYIGPGTLYITDQTLNTPVAITINNGVFNLNGIAQAQLPVLLANTVTAQTTSGTLAIGQAGDTGTLQLYRPITFSDSTVQSTAGIPLTQKGMANGVASLDSTGKVTAAQLPAGAVIFQGTWSAATNTPTLANGTGTAGYEYVVTASGTVNFGAGNITFTAGDFVIYNGTIWQRIPTGGLGVTSINGTLTGAVTGIVTTSDTGTVTNTMLAGSIANNKLVYSSITTTAGTGITLGGSSVALGGTLTITNAGVTSNVAGTGISVSGATGAVTITNTGVTAASAGSGISLSSSTGSVTITNTGVLSTVAGTHITVSAGTGNVTIGTDATSANTVSTIVARDSSGNFSAGTITANITGNVSGNAGTVTNGVYTTDTGTVTNTMLAGSIANSKLANSSVTVTAGTGLSGGGAVSLGGSVTLTNAGVTSIVAGTGISISGSTGAVTITNTGTTQTVSTWTPTLTFATTQGTQTYTTRVGNYVKTGQMVYATFDIVISSLGTGAGNFSLTMTGLPTPMTTTGAAGDLVITTQTIAATNPGMIFMAGEVTGGATSVAVFGTLVQAGGGGSTTYRQVTAADLGGTASITGKIQYISAS
jgi:hypothetical protein